MGRLRHFSVLREAPKSKATLLTGQPGRRLGLSTKSDYFGRELALLGGPCVLSRFPVPLCWLGVGGMILCALGKGYEVVGDFDAGGALPFDDELTISFTKR